jgi:hypothetical protein
MDLNLHGKKRGSTAASSGTDFDAVVKSLNDRRDKYDTSIDEDYRQDVLAKIPVAALSSLAGPQQPPGAGPNASWRFFYDEEARRATGRADLLMVETEEQAEAMRSRGYTEMPSLGVYGRNTSLDDLPFPEPAVPVAAAAAAPPVLPPHEQPPPPENEPPQMPMANKVPKLRRYGGGTDRDKYVECFEVKVVDEEEGKVWSPIRRWNKNAFAKDNGVFNSRLLAYYAVKKNLPTADNNLGSLKTAARHHSEIVERKEQMKQEKKTFAWFDVCLELHNNGTGSN